MCMTFGCNPQIICILDLVIFGLKAFRNWLSCERNSSCSFIRIISKVCRYLCQVLTMCMTFGCNPQIIICYFFGSSDLVIFGLKAFRHWVFCERHFSHFLPGSFGNSAGVFVEV